MTTSKAYMVLISVMLVTLLSMAGIALPYPILAPLFLESPASPLNHFAGLNPKLLLAGLLAIYPLGLLIGSSFIGAISDVYGRKNTLLVTLLIATFGYLLSGYAIIEQNYLLFLLARLLTGICEGNVSIARAIASDLHPVIDKTRAFSWIYATTYAGWLIGPLTGGYLMIYGPEKAFYVAAFAIFVALILVVFIIDETNSTKTSSNSSIKRIFRLAIKKNSLGLLKHAEIRKVFAIYLLVTLGLNAFYEFFPVWLVDSFSFSSVEIAHATAMQTVFMVLVSALLVEKIKNHFGKIGPIYLGLLLLAVCLIILPWLPSQLVYPFFAVTGALIALYNGLLPIYITDRYSDLPQGRLLGLLTTIFFMSNVIIAIVGGLVSLLGAKWSIFLGGYLMFWGLYRLFMFDTKMPKSSSIKLEAT